MKLRIAEDLALPIEAVTETFALLGARGSGKTNGSRVLAEEMYRAALPFVVVDPVGSWFGLRSSRDGKEPGLEVTILGGEYGDEPIDERAGEAVADFVVAQRPFLVIDLSSFASEATKKRFLLAFAVRLYQKNREALHLFLEEADDYIPQRMRGAGDEKSVEPQLLRAFENIVRRGRARGLGMTMITQRSAVLNKNVLTQAQTLIAFRTTGPQDRDAIEEWVKYHGQAKEIVASLAGLKDGEAWVWSPDFLRKTVRTRFRLSETFDSGRTPKPGEARRQPTARANVDLAGVRTSMAQSIERAKAEDPKALQAELRRLNDQVRRLNVDLEKARAEKPAPIQVEIPVLEPEQIERLETAVEGLRRFADVLTERTAHVAHAVSNAAQVVVSSLDAARRPAPAPVQRRETPQHAPARNSMPPRPARAVANGPVSQAAADLGAGERRVLTAIAQGGRVGVSKVQLSVNTGYKRSSRDTYLQRLRAAGLIELAGDGCHVATAAGIAVLGDAYEPLPTGRALYEYWRQRLPVGERNILEVVIREGKGGVVPKDVISGETGYKRSARDTYLQRLSARRLVEASRGGVRAAEELFG